MCSGVELQTLPNAGRTSFRLVWSGLGPKKTWACKKAWAQEDLGLEFAEESSGKGAGQRALAAAKLLEKKPSKIDVICVFSVQLLAAGSC